ncbi:MAG: hypothetical protein R3F04_11250 [Lysobacteraceae bacterium]
MSRFVLIRFLVALALASLSSLVCAEGKVTGRFVVNGVEAHLQQVRAIEEALDANGTTGYSLLLSAQAASGAIAAWRTGDPAEQGDFIYLSLEKNGRVWIAELGHTAAESGRFGVVTEVSTSDFHVQDKHLKVKLSSNGEQVFTDDTFAIDLTIEAMIE